MSQKRRNNDVLSQGGDSKMLRADAAGRCSGVSGGSCCSGFGSETIGTPLGQPIPALGQPLKAFSSQEQLHTPPNRTHLKTYLQPLKPNIINLSSFSLSITRDSKLWNYVPLSGVAYPTEAQFLRHFTHYLTKPFLRPLILSTMKSSPPNIQGIMIYSWLAHLHKNVLACHSLSSAS